MDPFDKADQTLEEARKLAQVRFQEYGQAQKAGEALYAVYLELLHSRASKKAIAVAQRHYEAAKAIRDQAYAAYQAAYAAERRAFKEFLKAMRPTLSPEASARIDAYLEKHTED